MIVIDKTEVSGWRASIRGMRNAMNSWDKSDTEYMVEFPLDIDKNPILSEATDVIKIGPNDLRLMKNLSYSGDDHGKFLRMIIVWCDITAPFYWWKEADTYRVGVEKNSCSTMHKIHSRDVVMEDFSIEHLHPNSKEYLESTIFKLNESRKNFINDKDKDEWWQMIQLLPTSYNQKRTMMFNYQALKNMYHARKNHKLDEWHDFCDWCLKLPYFKEICVDIYDTEANNE